MILNTSIIFFMKFAKLFIGHLVKLVGTSSIFSVKVKNFRKVNFCCRNQN